MSHVFDRHVAVANRWLKELATDLALPSDDQRALHALRAGLHAIRDRLPPAEVLDLAAQLPVVIRGFYYECWTLGSERLRDRAGMLEAVKTGLAPNELLDPAEVLGAVIRLLVAHVSRGEIADVVATLPKPIASLWCELAAAAPVLPVVTHSGERTGYRR
jgi:uncharacterized protein (DUF2267 family)